MMIRHYLAYLSDCFGFVSETYLRECWSVQMTALHVQLYAGDEWCCGCDEAYPEAAAHDFGH